MAISASTSSAFKFSRIRSTPPPTFSGLVRDEPRIVPPRGRMPRVTATSSGIVRFSSCPFQPSRNPRNSWPYVSLPFRTAARITALRPGQSPPPVSIPIRMPGAYIGSANVTFSIVATDGEAWGVAVASKFLGVGAAVPAAAVNVGAIATQSWANLAYRPDGLAMLRDGKSAQETLDALTAADEMREERQAGIVDAEGRAATFTGTGCNAWAGGVTGHVDGHGGYAIQGNILVGPQVVEAMQQAWLATDRTQPLTRRLLAALKAGDDAGGDKRGRQSAALLVVTEAGGYGGGSDVFADLRVDDHEQPVTELARLLDLHDIYFGKPDPATALALEGQLADEVRTRLANLGHENDDLDKMLADWAGIENYEERLLPGKIDQIVLEQLRAKSNP